MLEKLLAKRHIQNLDLGSVRANAMAKLGWSSEKHSGLKTATGAFFMPWPTRKKMTFFLRHRRRWTNSGTSTFSIRANYREDCHTVFGYYIDHTPQLSPEDQRRADARREQVYRDYKIDAISFATPNPQRSRDEGGGFDGDFSGCSGGSSYSSGHHSHGHDSGAHSGHAGADHGDGGGHGNSGGDSGGSDAGGGDGGSGCGGAGCGGG